MIYDYDIRMKGIMEEKDKQMGKVKTQIQKKNLVLFISFTVMFAAAMFIWGLRFGTGGDLGAHAEVALKLNRLHELPYEWGHIKTYPLWHYVFRVCYTFVELFPIAEGGITVSAVALTETLFLTVTFGLVWGYLYFSDVSIKKHPSIIYAVMAIGLMMAGPFYIKAVNKAYYLGQVTPNPWHNPTIIAVKPFAIGAFYYYIRSLDAYKKNEICDIKGRRIKKENIYLMMFALILAVSAFGKPSFYQMFIPGLFLFCVAEIIKTRFHSFWFCVKTGIAIIPTCMIAIYQFSISISGMNRMYIKWGEIWGDLTNHILLSILISIIFPIFMLIVSYKQLLSERRMQLAVFAFLSGVLQFAVFSFEVNWGCDFAWGAYLGTFLLFLAASDLLLKWWHEKGLHWVTVSGSILFGMHVLFGTWYWVRMYQQMTFFI